MANESKHKRPVSVVQDPEDEVPVKVLAKAIQEIATAAQKLTAGPLTKRAVVVLIQDGCYGVNKATIEAVIDSAASLAKRYVR